MGIYDREYMKRPWKLAASKLPELRVLKEKKPLSYWTLRIILLLAGLELGLCACSILAVTLVRHADPVV
jgi:hypothetical protein